MRLKWQNQQGENPQAVEAVKTAGGLPFREMEKFPVEMSGAVSSDSIMGNGAQGGDKQKTNIASP